MEHHFSISLLSLVSKEFWTLQNVGLGFYLALRIY